MPPDAHKRAENCSDCEYRESRLFCNLGPEEVQALEAIGAHVDYPGGALVFEENQPPNGVFIVCSGHLKLSASSREGRTMILKIAGPGDVLGLSAVLNDVGYEVTAETLDHCELKSIRRAEFLKFLETYGQVGRHAARSLAKEYQEAFLDARRLALSGSAAGRLAWLMLDWARTSSRGKEELRFTMALTHDELASLAGASRETVTRLLNQMEREGKIKRRGASILILKPKEMEALVR